MRRALAGLVVVVVVTLVAVWPRGGRRAVRFATPTVVLVPFSRFAPDDAATFASATPGGSLIERQQSVVLSPAVPVVLPDDVTPAAFAVAAAPLVPARLASCEQAVWRICPAAAYLLVAAATDADGDVLPSAVAAARLTSLARAMRADGLGWGVRERLWLRGGRGLLRWSLLDAATGRPVFGAWVAGSTAYRVSSGRTMSFWVPLPGRREPLVLRLDAYVPPAAASAGSLCLRPAGGSHRGFARTSCTSRMRRSRKPASE